MPLVERLLAWSIFPVVIGMAVVGTAWTIGAGMDPALAVGPWIAGAYFVIAVSERLFPHQRRWLRNHGDLGVDVVYFLSSGAVQRGLELIILSAGIAATGWLEREYGAALWPAHWPLLMQLVPALVVAEFFEYSFHRLMHEVPWLWRFHAPHHAVPRLYWLNAVHFHPIDIALVGAGKLVLLALIGCPEATLALVTVVSAVHGAFQHSNIRLRLGPLNWVFSMAELHRWHHAPEAAVANHNYGGNLIIWDIVFGTRYLPKDREPPAEIGIADLPNFPTSFWGQVRAPFRWADTVRQARA